MLALFSANKKFGLWRRLWLELARCEQELGITRITDAAIADMAAHLDDIDFASATAWEKRFRHDVKAHIHVFEEAAPAARGIIHLGATSQYVVDNADLIIMREAMRLLARRVAACIDSLGTFADKWKHLPTLGYTHYQPAQPTTVGKRATLWIADLVMDLQELQHRLATLKFRGVKGTVGTQASFLSLFDGDGDKCDRLDQMVTGRFDFPGSYPVTGQTYSRKVDSMIVNTLAGIATTVHKFANDIRLLSGMKQIDEPFEAEQVGSSAMAYKRNPMRCERATGLARFVMSLASSPMATAAEQWFERTLDDSSNKRLAVAEAFLATDGCLVILENVVSGLVVYPKTIEMALRAELPFMATEELLMGAVQAGGDREVLHEKIRTHSLEAAKSVKLQGGQNDLVERLLRDQSFSGVDFDNLLDARKFIGRAPAQVTHFLQTVVDPIRTQFSDARSSAELVI
jgi:adenylosuccinate lyase